MGETAKISARRSGVLMPDLDATCSLDLGSPPMSSPLSVTPSRSNRCGVRDTSAAVEGAGGLDGDIVDGLEIVADLHARAKNPVGT